MRKPRPRWNKTHQKWIIVINGFTHYLSDKTKKKQKHPPKSVVEKAKKFLEKHWRQGEKITNIEVASKYEETFVADEKANEHFLKVTVLNEFKQFDPYCNQPIKDFGPKKLMGFRRRLRNIGFSKLEINCFIGLLNDMFEWAWSKKIIKKSILNKLAKVHPYSNQEIQDEMEKLNKKEK